MSSARIFYTSRQDSTPEQARDTRARAWKFIFDAYREKAAEQGNGKTKQKSLNAKEGGCMT